MRTLKKILSSKQLLDKQAFSLLEQPIVLRRGLFAQMNSYCPKRTVYYLHKLFFSKFFKQTRHLLVYSFIFSEQEFPETNNKVTLMKKASLVVSLIGKLYRCRQSQFLVFEKESNLRKQNHTKNNRIT